MLKRHKLLVKKEMQFRYLGLVIGPSVAFLIGLYWLIYYCLMNQIVIPEALATTLLPAMKKVNVVLAVSLPVLLFLILRRALIYSNRIIGPIPRLEKKLDEFIAGNYSIRLSTRQDDELKTFVEKINLALEKAEGRPS